jgi:diguanylate cyclase (GGDEF)-like protein
MRQAEGAEVGRVLDAAWLRHHEDGAGALADAIRGHEIALALDDALLCARALAVQAAVTLYRGDLRGAFVLAADAHRQAERSDDDRARAEVAAVKAQLSFFAGSYAESLRQAKDAIALADRVGDLQLRVFARRSACLVFGNVGVHDWTARLDELLRLAIASGNRWEEAISRNDLAHALMDRGELAGAEDEIERALVIADELAPDNRFMLGVLLCTRADISLHGGRAEEALADTARAIDLLAANGEPNPYVLAMTVVVEVGALLALGRLEEAERSGQRAATGLGDRVPQARSLILGTVATALREAGRVEEAYDALARSVELERVAFRELSELQLGLERATLETEAARHEAAALAAKNRELEALQDQLRDQADRDWLTGLHNRRYLARELERHAREGLAAPFSIAVLDLDHFKSVNDQFGHEAGDRVLVRVAALLAAELRTGDAVVRSGGEEFVVLMPGTGSEAAGACCERICRRIRDETWDRVAPGVQMTTSVGLATEEQPTDLGALAQTADRRLYEAKQAGRDRVVAMSLLPS